MLYRIVFSCLACLPIWVLKLLANKVYFWIYYVIGYRKKVVRKNLNAAFPQFNVKQLKQLEKDFYKHFAQLILEALKIKTINAKAVEKAVEVDGSLKVFTQYTEQKQSCIVVLGHTGNWELLGARFALLLGGDLTPIYYPVKNKAVENWILKMRARFGARLFSSKEVLRMMVKFKHQFHVTALIADQTPSYTDTYWTVFLNQETPFLTGPERLAKKFNQAVIYAQCYKLGFMRYKVVFELISDAPMETQENEITEKIVQSLTVNILNQPHIWLWTHRRWKKNKIFNT